MASVSPWINVQVLPVEMAPTAVPLYTAGQEYFPTSIAVSRDGSRIYVVNGNDIDVIDAATRTVIGAVRFPGYMSDTAASASQPIAVDSNGDILSYGGSGLVSVSLGTSTSTSV
jgi:DNA-binding beta-propeller fold protein YncE